MAGVGLSGEAMTLDAPISTRFVAATVANLGGWSPVSNDALSRMTNLSPRTVKRALQWLESNGHLQRRGPNRYRKIRTAIAPYRNTDPDRRWVPDHILELPLSAERRIWLAFVEAHSSASVVEEYAAEDGFGGVMLSDAAIARRLGVDRSMTRKARHWALAAGLIETTAGNNQRGGWKLRDHWEQSDLFTSDGSQKITGNVEGISGPVEGISGPVDKYGPPEGECKRDLEREPRARSRSSGKSSESSERFRAIFALDEEGRPVEWF